MGRVDGRGTCGGVLHVVIPTALVGICVDTVRDR